jgi:hypothetical protein
MKKVAEAVTTNENEEEQSYENDKEDSEEPSEPETTQSKEPLTDFELKKALFSQP